MKLQLLIAFLGAGVLLIIAALDKSPGMAVSALGIGLALWLTREKPLSIRLGAIVAGALVGTFSSELVHTLYHLFGGQTASGDSGFFFVSAFLVGLINAAGIAALVLLAHVLVRPPGQQPEGA